MLAEAFDTLYLLTQQIILRLDYAGIALVLTLTAPEVILPFTGFLVARGELSFLGVLLASTLGSMIGATAVYLLARKFGEVRLRAFLRRYGSWLLLYEQDLNRALRLFDRHGDIMLLVSRVILSVRSMVIVPAGLLPMSLSKFLLISLVGTLACNAGIIYAGVVLGRNWQRVLHFVEVYDSFIWITLALLVGLFLARRLGRRLLARTAFDRS